MKSQKRREKIVGKKGKSRLLGPKGELLNQI